MKGFVMIGILALLSVLTVVPDAAQPRPHEDIEGRRPIVTGADSCLPIKLADGMPIITASLGGRDLSFGFDTGAPGGPLLSPAVIKELKLRQTGEAQMTDPSMKNVVTTPLYELRDLKIANFTIEKWEAAAHPARESRRFAEPDGIIGLTAFAGYVVTIDYPGRRILLAKGRLPEPDGRSSFHYEGPIPRVPLTVEGHAIEAHVDSGNARYGLIVPEALASQLAGYAKQFPIGIARTVNNTFDLKAIPIADARVGDFPLYAGTAAFPSTGNRANLGSALLKDMLVLVDPANAIVSLKRAPAGLENGCPKT